jgi:class 3 adenylate cyclase/tetratricopeptide (TPR) repeat protein
MLHCVPGGPIRFHYGSLTRKILNPGGFYRRVCSKAEAMHCSKCGTDNAPSNRYCEMCGVRLVLSCPKCRHQNTPTARFCAHCGCRLQTVRQANSEKGHGSRSSGQERKQATVLFADIVGSTQSVAGIDPEEAMGRLQPAVVAMCEAVEHFDGTVVRVMGDGVMALFGAPHAQEGHALLACEAAITMQQRFPPEASYRIRVGIHSGEIIATAAVGIGREQDAHGSTIHLAQRMEQIAEPGAICLTEDCYRLVRSSCDVQRLGRRTIKGFPEPIEVYDLIRLKPAVASQQFRGPILSSFRGRELELGELQRALDAEDRQTRVIGICGAPGTGKSRLCYEFAEWCRDRLISVYEARAMAYGHATPLQPVLELLRLFFRILPTDDAAIARRRIGERLTEIGATFRADLPLVCEFLGVKDDGQPSSPLGPKARHRRLQHIVLHLVRLGGLSPSVILIEDLHWLDEASEDFVATIAEAVTNTGTLLLVNYRPSYGAQWMDGSSFRQLSLAELSLPATEALVRELIGNRRELNEIRRRVAERSGGNPFFAEELVRSLVESGSLVGILRDYRLAADTTEASLPATIQSVIGARIDRLGQVEKGYLQIAAVIGKEFAFRVLHDVTRGSARKLEAVLERLCEAEMLQKQPGLDGRWFAFRHPLLQEVAYVTQLKARRNQLHASVAHAIRDFRAERIDEFSGLLAYHFEAAGQMLEAARYAARAATWVGSTNSAQAIKHWRKVHALQHNQPRSNETDTLRIMANGQIAWLGWREGMTTDEATPLIDEALALSRETDNSMIPLLLFVHGRITVTSGGPADTYVDRVKEALSLIRDGEDIGRVATLNAALSQAYGWAGRLNEALAANTAALAGISKVRRFDHQFLGYSVEHWAMALRGRILVRLGRFEDAATLLDSMLDIEQDLVDPTLLLIPHLGYVDMAWCLDDATMADKHARRIGEIADRYQNPYLQVFASACAGTAKGIAGDFSDAIDVFREGLAFLHETRAAMEYEPEMIASLADCYYRKGELESAMVTAREAIELARRRSARLPECRASISLGGALRAAYGGDRANEVEDLFQSAENLIQITGASIYERLLSRDRDCLSTKVASSLRSREKGELTQTIIS